MQAQLRRVRQQLPLADEETDALDGWDAEVGAASSPEQLKQALGRLESALPEDWLSPLLPAAPPKLFPQAWPACGER